MLALCHVASAENLRGGELDLEVAELMQEAITETDGEHPAVADAGAAEADEEEAYVVSASDVKDATAHAVDQTLVGKAEEELAEKEAEDPLLADPLLSLEKEHEDDDALDGKIEALDEAMEDEEERLFYDPKLFSKDTVEEMDVNNDGFLDETELINHLTVAIDKVRQDELLKQKEVNADGVKDIMSMMDDNGDGKLSKEEMFGKTTQSSKQATADNRMFDFADGAFGNKDGELDEDEIFIMALPQYSADRKGWYKFKAEDHMEEMDTNGDNEVSYQEYNDAMEMAVGEDIADEMLATKADQTWLGEGDDKTMTYRLKRKLFTEADLNHDMKLDVDEMATMVEMLETKNLKDVCDDLIKVADDNEDNKLALSEIIAHVTDFGGHMAFFLNDPELLFPSNKFKVSDVDGANKRAPTKKFVTKALARTATHAHKDWVKAHKMFGGALDDSIVNTLAKITEQHKQGILTDEEFKAAKKTALGLD